MKSTWRNFRSVSCLLFLLYILFFVLPVKAGKNTLPDSAELASYALLDKTVLAARDLNYSGVFIIQQGQEIHIARISHMRHQGHILEKLENLDGDRRETLRTDNVIRSILPAQRRILIESKSSEKSFPALNGLQAEHIRRYYQMHAIHPAESAGRAAIVLNLTPRDAWRYGYRLWIDQSSNLLLRAQTLNEKSEVVEQIAFHELTLQPLTSAQLASSYPDTKGWQIHKATLTPLELSPWGVKWLPDGFLPTRAVKRLVAESSEKSAKQKEMMQFVYSDGLAGISIFIEPWAAQKAMVLGRPGALNVVGKRMGEFWLTIVGEVPLQTIRQVAESIDLNLTQ